MFNITCGICLVPAWRGALVGCRESLLFTLSEAYTAVPLDRGALKGFSLCNRVRVTKLKTAGHPQAMILSKCSETYGVNKKKCLAI